MSILVSAERHRSGRGGWLRAAVLGANDGVVSTASFASLALLPIAALLLAPAAWHVPAIGVSALISLAVLGGLGGHLGGAPVLRAAIRAALGGGFAMAVTTGIGHLLGLVAVG